MNEEPILYSFNLALFGEKLMPDIQRDATLKMLYDTLQANQCRGIEEVLSFALKSMSHENERKTKVIIKLSMMLPEPTP